MTPAERTYARPPGLCTCQSFMHGSGKAAAVNRAPPATGVRKQPFIASESANARRPPTGAWTRARDGTNTIMDSDGAGQPDQQAGVIHSRASQCRLGRAAQGGSAPADCTHTRRPPATQASTTPASQRQPLQLRQPPEADCNDSSLRPTPAGRLRGPGAGQCRRIHGLGRRGPARPAREGGPLASYIDSHERPRAGARRPTARILGGQSSAPATQSSTTPASQRPPLQLRQLPEADYNGSSLRPTPAGRLRGPGAGQCRRIPGLGQSRSARPAGEGCPLANNTDTDKRPRAGARQPTARTLGQESRRPEQRARHPSKHVPGKPAAVF